MPAGFVLDSVLLPPSPLSVQVLFVGGVDLVQTTKTYGNPAGQQFAKEWHDFIGFTKDTTNASFGWISVNHEMVYRDDRIGDGGGMTVFRVKRNANDQLEVVDQTLTDGRKGKFFNVDFVNTVGETGMNCAGISSTIDGRIWTAEEWFRTNNSDINNGQNVSAPNTAGAFPMAPGRTSSSNAPNQGVRDTADFTIRNSGITGFDSLRIRKFQNFNWMVEIDPRQAKAIRKQYNWGRQGFEGGAIAADNKTVYLGEDATPGWFSRFVADTPGDFTKGKMYVYKHDTPSKWVEIPAVPDSMLNFSAAARAKGATGYARPEWVAIDPKNNKVYWAETGVDNLGPAFAAGVATGATIDPGHTARAISKGFASATDANYKDYYGRIWVYDPATLEHFIYLEGGPDFAASPAEAAYPSKHLTNPDGLNVMQIDGKSFLVINEDLNGTTFGRTPAGVSNPTCEVYLLDLNKANPTVNDLIRLTAVPRGAEVTGAMPTPDGKSLLLNIQHPSASNPFPYNHSLTFVINGFDRLKTTALQNPEVEKSNELLLYPNPTRRTVFMNKTIDAAIYDASGKRIRVVRNTNELNVEDLTAGIYFVQTADGEIKKLIIQ